METLEVILKVTSICNLNCKYCYVFNGGDSSYRREPSVIEDSTCLVLLERIRDFCKSYYIKDVLFVFHGGEPLLAPMDFFDFFVAHSRKIIPKSVRVLYNVQTNGTLLTKEYVKHLINLNISIGVSLDGSKIATSDRVFRKDAKEAYDSIIYGINLLKNMDVGFGVLSVLMMKDSPKRLYEGYKQHGIELVDLLFPDISYDNKDGVNPNMGEYIIDIFDIWYNDIDDKKPSIRFFELIIGRILGFDCGNEVIGCGFNNPVCIKSNGNIQLVDSIVSCMNGGKNVTYNVKTNSLSDFFESDISKLYFNAHQDSVLCTKCRKCCYVDIYGGGQLSHRYSKRNGFNNPTVYCEVMVMLIRHINKRIMEDLKI